MNENMKLQGEGVKSGECRCDEIGETGEPRKKP